MKAKLATYHGGGGASPRFEGVGILRPQPLRQTVALVLCQYENLLRRPQASVSHQRDGLLPIRLFSHPNYSSCEYRDPVFCTALRCAPTKYAQVRARGT